MVESAPQDRKRLAPSMAKPIEPAMKAKKPICGAKPPSRAVAICSGIAIAASVSPATRSAGRKAGRHDASDENSDQDFSASASCAIATALLMPCRNITAFSWLAMEKRRDSDGAVVPQYFRTMGLAD